MLKIQVLGRGLIPRGHGLAPKKDPFPADLMTIGAILSTPGLSATYIHPEKNKALPLTRDNYQTIYKKFDNAHLSKKEVPEQKLEQEVELTDHIHTVVGSTTVEPPVETVEVVEAAAPVEEKKEVVVVETKEQDFVVTPAIKPEEGNKIEVKVGGHTNNNNYNKNQNNNRNGNR
jgi:hypothetical protein